MRSSRLYTQNSEHKNASKKNIEKAMSEVYARTSLARLRQHSRCKHACAPRLAPPCPQPRTHPRTQARARHAAPVQSISNTRFVAALTSLTPHHHHSSSPADRRHVTWASIPLLATAFLAACTASASSSNDQHIFPTHLHTHAAQHPLSTASTALHAHRTAPQLPSSLHPW